MTVKTKLRSRRGESLTETLAAVLVIALAAAAMLSMIAAGARITARARAFDDATYAGLSFAELQNGTGEAGRLEAAVGAGASVELDVEYFRDPDSGLCSYRVTP